MQQQTVTLIVAGLGIAGTLASGAISQWMTRRSQHDQWLRDQRKQEWRELLTSLASAYATITRLERYMVALDSDDQRALDAAHDLADNTIRDRIFIAPDIGDMNLTKLWAQVIGASRRGEHGNADRSPAS